MIFYKNYLHFPYFEPKGDLGKQVFLFYFFFNASFVFISSTDNKAGIKGTQFSYQALHLKGLPIASRKEKQRWYSCPNNGSHPSVKFSSSCN